MCRPEDVQAVIEELFPGQGKGLSHADAVEIARIHNEEATGWNAGPTGVRGQLQTRGNFSSPDAHLILIGINEVLHARDNSSGSSLVRAVRGEADTEQLRPGSQRGQEVTVAEQNGVQTVGVSGSDPTLITQAVRDYYAQVPKGNQSNHHMRCGEVFALSALDRAGQPLAGARIATAHVAGAGETSARHGLSKPLCSSCDWVAKALGLVHVRE